MDDINEKILATLQAEVQTDIPSEDHISLLGLVRRGFRGAMAITGGVVIFMVIVCAGLAIYCGYNMFETTDVGLKVQWASGLILAFVLMIVLRLWFYLELSRLSVIRETKRVELQLSLLAKKLSD